MGAEEAAATGVDQLEKALAGVLAAQVGYSTINVAPPGRVAGTASHADIQARQSEPSPSPYRRYAY